MKSKLYVAIVVLLLLLPLQCLAGDYVIGEGDTLDISVWGVRELTFSVKVRPDGKITIPGLGEIVASGTTPSELQVSLGSKLKEMVKNPIVTVTVREITNSRVYVFGGGVRPAVYDLSRRTSLLQLLCTVAEVKGADLRKAYLMRDGKKVESDIFALFVKGDVSQDRPLESNDILFLPVLTDKSVYVLGAVTTPKAIEYREGMRVMEAILESGGFTKFADQNDILVRRKSEKEPLTVKAKSLMKKGDLSQNIELKAGDYVIVRESFF